ncbi:cyclopropane-fatty-acyl-phospholipid synthase [Lentzea albidocapillata subsp. violacea]|uniref:Cyclopropane-fatty-acyl-phospholipid synthase n=1 Tax=Lentzea albidocapillata subsp. violacea TaxID=128104 RepID=A0A1G9R179_9PSEU|nr:cyclopropane-fatty-acyl-phospholipid synthase family protein [Lentzea albidocapillata]SDM16891.1 cyclopropane-fatty-acyl-phospholipid synthase [Lentzea albidocapillata subsp. violacea]
MRRTEHADALDLDWPHLRPRGANPLRAYVARRMFLWSVRKLPLSVLLPNGERHGGGNGQFKHGGDPALLISDPETFFSRLGSDGALGFGESHLLNSWTSGSSPEINQIAYDELAAWLAIYGRWLRKKESALTYQARAIWQLGLPRSEANSRLGARSNVRAHYDLDSRLFELFLDESMTYSSAWFEPGDDLATAQRRKIDAILDLARVGPGSRLLDIGSGFGALACRAASEREANVVGLTLSSNQLKHATTHSEERGIGELVRFRLEDYREHSGSYDSVVSVEMIEAVGSEYWEEYFQTVDRLLRPGGWFALQAITFRTGR